jgi:hypothetical protein
MTYQTSDFRGDETYCIECTGDVVTGDEVSFDQATFSGSRKRPKFDGFRRVAGKIVSESYGDKKQQHTFTAELVGGGRLLIKGRNLYANGCFRKPWADENLRYAVADEKHTRGDAARAARAVRIEERF